MGKTQKYILLILVSFYLVHLVRDILQDLTIDTYLASIMVKVDKSNTPTWYWKIFNTYLMEISGLLCALVALMNNRFKPFGFLSVFILIIFLTVWLYYWLYL